MAENNATCSICGKDYYACLSCHDSLKVNPWKLYTDTSEHYKVFQVVRGFSTNIYTKDEARAKLENINLEDIESFRPHIKQIVKDILKEEKIVVESVDKAKKPIEIEVTAEKMAVEKSAYSRKRNYKVNNEV